MSNLLEQLVENEPPKAEPTTTATPEKVEMLTIKECTEAVKGLNEYTVRQLIARKEIPSIRTGQGKRGKADCGAECKCTQKYTEKFPQKISYIPS